MNEVLIVGAGIAGLTFALELYRHHIPRRIFDAALALVATELAFCLVEDADTKRARK